MNIIDGLIVNNINTVIGNLDNLPNPELSHSMLNERFDLLKENNIPLHVQDARDYNGLSNIINQINPNIIVHLAAVSHANRSNKDPFSTFDHSLRTSRMHLIIPETKWIILSIFHQVWYTEILNLIRLMKTLFVNL